ncbi:uncharacterized protein BDZ99DRAFT_362938, partial [Mytilinidion resinicola]
WGYDYFLWAYPEQRQMNTVIYLRTNTPALITYVLGPEWKTELDQSGHKYLEKPDEGWADVDEAALALRMRRAGGAVIDISKTYGMAWLYEDVCTSEWWAVEKRRKYVFGWPETGGVLVLALP